MLRTTLAAATARLAAAVIDSPRLHAESLMMFVLGCDRAYLYAHPERQLQDEESARYAQAIQARASGTPTQYITGHQEFWGLDFFVSPAVLIPRPETEHLIEEALRLAGAEAESATTPHPRIVDVGTGSGCIAIALVKELAPAEIHATDISGEALEIARRNAVKNEVADRIQFHEVDLLQGFAPATFDFVVSNPPYVGEFEEDQVQIAVRKFEPRKAVFAGPTGVEIIERLVPQARTALRPGGWLLMEISGAVAEAVKRLLRDWAELRIIDDLQQIPRVAVAKNRP